MSLKITHSYRFGDFTVDTDQGILLRHGSVLPLRPKVFETLLILVENSGRLIKKDELMSRLWPASFVEESNLTFNIKELRKALADDARQPRYIETVARRGYRFIAEVEEVLTDSNTIGRQVTHRFETLDARSAIGAQGVSDSDTGKTGKIEPGFDKSVQPETDLAKKKGSGINVRKTALAVGAVAIVLILSGWLLWPRISFRAQPSGKRVMLAVLPFKNLTGDAAQEYFSDGLTEEMIAQLGNLDPQQFGIIARTSVMHYKNSQKQLDQIGRELGVEYVLEGSVRRDSDRVRIAAQLIQVRDQTHIWSRQYDRDLRGLLVLQREIGYEIANQIKLALGNKKPIEPSRQPLPSAATYEAYELCLKGRFFWNKRTVEGFEQAIEYFQRAIERDPNYAPAYVGLANCYALIGGYSARPQTDFISKARAAALRALAIDEGSAEAHTALALIVQNYDWDWRTAEKEFRRAIELNPNYATAHHWYAEHLMWQGRFDEALHQSEQARLLDPLSLIIGADNAAILYYSRQYERAIEKCRTVLEMEPTFPRAHHIMIMAYIQEGKFADALTDIEKHYPNLGVTWNWSELTYAYGRSGQDSQARRALEMLLEMNRRQQVDAEAFIRAYVGLDDKEQAFAWLEKAYSQRSNVLTSLKVEPRYDPLRNDPRFQDLMRRVGSQ